MEVILLLALAGSFAGFIAGLLGIGGGMIIVPVVLWAMQLQGAGDTNYSQHIAVGTSFAVMVFTSFSSMMSQHKKGAVDWHVFKSMVPGMIAGVAGGSLLAKVLPKEGLQIFFVVFTIVIAVRTLMDAKPKPTRHLPGRGGLFGMGGLFGVLSSWIGIGGGSLSVPFMVFCNVPVHKAVGTSAALGWPIALTGAIAYLINGWDVAGLPPGSLGFVYWPAALVLAMATLIFAPLGVKVSHKLPPEKLKLAFGILLLVIAVRMAWQLVR
ncbi:MAG: sulfite exporter TauE/SafE family protein [Neisseria sp.]|uniref:sulfite exporter TauE/SafE family protein n=1 Tax=Neisseria sp. TaxID=192066 RepID=UPI0026DD3B47|nr:sulfite exporter TauE/SafE family protein [Neisseria sp.]MDO4642047.1 sulfite exporter TauE/SafE family protein [Neisseria sp.]